MSTIKLPSPPVPMHGFFTALHKGYIVPITDTDLRARDLEVARVVLEAAAKVCDDTHAEQLAQGTASPYGDAFARRVHTLEFKHE